MSRPLLGAVTAAMVIAASAQAEPGNPDGGDAQAGRELALDLCSPCHRVISHSARPRRFVIAPDFTAIANTSGMTTTALKAFLATPHPRMPNLILSREETADIVAYILSLRGR